MTDRDNPSAKIAGETWVFVSHASQDLPKVRQVRNYLEDLGASPLLFHLLSLQSPDEFWPVIEAEITARNFFLYCDSPAAENSKWVRKERDAVRTAVSAAPKRIGRIDVSRHELDVTSLDDFLRTSRVFFSYTRSDRDVVSRYAEALAEAEFNVFRDELLTAGMDFKALIEHKIADAARRGWIIVFWSNSSAASDWVRLEIRLAISLGGNVFVVQLDDTEVPFRDYPLCVIDAKSDPDQGVTELVAKLLSLSFKDPSAI